MSKNTLRGAAICLLSLALVTSCLDELDIKAPKSVQGGIVINSKLVMGNPSVIQVDLNRVFDFTGQSLQRVGARNVMLRNDLGEEIEIPELDAGLHRLEIFDDMGFTVEPGVSFQLSLSTFDGRDLISDMDKLCTVPAPTEVNIRNIEKDGVNGLGENIKVPFLEFSVETPIQTSESSERARLKWDFHRTYQVSEDGGLTIAPEPRTCYISETANPTRVSVEDGNRFVTDVITTSVYEEQIGPIMAEGYLLTIYQQSLSPEAFDYWDAVAQSIERTGNLFEAPAGLIKSNIKVATGSDEDSQIFGYFYVTQQDTIRKFVTPAEVGNPARFCPPPPAPAMGCPRDVCCNCPGELGSAQSPPPFWEF
ncbi:MAG: DUF4249 domain-containing protein [Saprospiraceae bacterium]|nr:DUF4249 domain-containing protein [Saprospiraceae bacterium]